MRAQVAVDTDSYKENQRKLAQYQARMRRNPTQAELLVKSALDKLGVHFVFQKGFLRQPTLRIVDFYLPNAGICLEVDGLYHEKQLRYDQYREGQILSQRVKALSFIRVTNEWVTSQKNLAASLSKKLAQ